MNLDLAEAAVMTGLAATAVLLGCCWIRTTGRLRRRISHLEGERSARDRAVAHLAAALDPGGGPSSVVFEVPEALKNTAFGRDLASVSAGVTVAVREAQAGAERAAADRADRKVQEATRAAVRALATAVVSAGATLGQTVSRALEEHRGGAAFATLTRIDHTAQQMTLKARSFLVLCGGWPGQNWPATPVGEVVRGAMGRVRDFPRVRAQQLDVAVVSRAVEPLVHTVAVLLGNALQYSPPTSTVEVGFQRGHAGLTLVIDDAGIGMSPEQLAATERILAGGVPDLHRLGPHPRTGLYAAAALAGRYGFRVRVAGASPYGGLRVTVFVPDALLTAVTEAPVAPVAAEPAPATVHGLPRRRRAAPELPAPTAEEPVPAPGTASVLAGWTRGTRTGRAAAQSPALPEGNTR
ncbi:ATP-binding protein [Streptomyces sp. NPDC057638]|uniref:ATP-binding protein n=1 Tax=Streptomyces sp. NPDC057638 TaxID=3346190 RepID=UPI0036D1C66D